MKTNIKIVIITILLELLSISACEVRDYINQTNSISTYSDDLDIKINNTLNN